MPQTSGIRIDGQRQYLHQKNLNLSLALLARTIDYKKWLNTAATANPCLCDEKHGCTAINCQAKQVLFS
jgi:hypothetical protein